MARKIEVQIVGDASKLSKAFNQAGDSGGKFGKNMMKVGKFAALGLAGAGAAAAVAGKKMIDMASDAAEVQSKMEVVFGKTLPGLTKEIDKFSAATGTSRFAMREQAADLGALLAPLVGSKQAAADMSLQFTKLATDLGSFNNVPTADALLAIRSGLVGEAEPLRRFGVLLNEAAVKAEGLRLGLVKGKEEMSEQEKVQARASLIMKQTTLAQGDATRTAGSFANQMKALRTNISDTATAIGIELLPTALRLVQGFNEHWPRMREIAAAVFQGIGDAFTKLRDVFVTIWPQIKESARAVMAWYRDNLEPTIVSVSKNIGKAWNKMLEEMKRDSESNLGGGGGVSGVVKTKMEGMRSFTNAILAAMRGDWSKAWAELKNGVRSNVEAMVTLWITAWTKILTTVRSINNALVGAVTAGINKATGFVKAKFQQLIDWFSGLPARFRSAAVAIGSGIADGIISGIGGLASRLGGALRDKIQSGIDSAKSFFGISSPSKVTAKEIGEPLAAGIAQGMANGLAVLKAQVAPALDAIAKMMADKAKAAREKFERTFDGMSDRIMRSFDAIRDAISTPAEAALAAISDRRQTEDLNRALQDAIAGGDPEAIARAQEDIQIASLQRQAETERRALDQQTEAMREKLTTKLDVMGQVWKGGTNDILKLLQGFGVDFENVGALLGTAFRQSLIASINGASTAAGGKGGVKNSGGGGGGAPIVLQTFLDGKLVAESTRNHNAIYARANGVPAT